MSLSRRAFLQGTGVAGLGIVLAGCVDALFTVPDPAAPTGRRGLGYGALVPDPNGLLDLPEGFRYRVLSPAGDRLSTGGLVPGAQDGMGVFARPTGLTLVRNHELSTPLGKSVTAAADRSLVFDPFAGGGTTTIDLGPSGSLGQHRVSLAGTIRNCAGGRTPWNTWITCEETEAHTPNGPHGWNFEVDPFADSRNADPVPLRAMGRFRHEAVGVDPSDGTVYQTEDAGGPSGLLYRFVPHAPLGGYGSLREGGALSALKVAGVDDLAQVTEPGTVLREVSWVPVPDPLAERVSTREQFAAAGEVTRAQKLEGAWWDGDALFFASSYHRGTTRPAHNGQVWKYTPADGSLELVLRIATGGRFDSPDNICVSPFGGGVMIAEDGDGDQYLVGTTADNEPYAFARNALNSSELAGVVFAPDAGTLFVNIYEPGMTLAITGPWADQVPGRP